MEETNNRKMNFFVKVYKSITNFDNYKQFAKEPLSKALKYLAILILIFSIIVSAIYIGNIGSKISSGIAYLDKNIDNISFSNGIFSYNNDEYTIYDEEKNIVPIAIIDTSENPNIEEYKNKVKLYNYGFILLRNKMMLYVATPENSNEFIEFSYADYNIENMDKEEILKSLNNPIIYINLAIIVFIVEFIEYFIYILLNAIALAIMGQLFALILRLRLKFSETYKMAIYALTLPTLLELLYIIINNTTGLVIQYFSWMYTTISYIYICVAILMIKTDFINMQKQLIKIEMEQHKDEEEQNEIEDTGETKDEEKENKEDKDSGENGDLKEQTDS